MTNEAQTNSTLSCEASYTVVGMNCASCARSAENVLQHLSGVNRAQVTFASQTARLSYNPKQLTFEALQAALHPLGFQLIQNRKEAEAAEVKRLQDLKLKMWIAVGLAALVVVLSMFLPATPYNIELQIVLSLPVVFYCGSGFFVSAFRQAQNFRVSMDTLVALGAGLAFVLSLFQSVVQINTSVGGHSAHSHLFYESAAVIVAFVLVGNYIEQVLKLQSQDTLGTLEDISPQTACVKKSDVWVKVPAEQVQVGEIIKIAPGERIPTDAVLRAGHTYVDESMLSGEPLPIEKHTQDTLLAGTLNLMQTIEATVSRKAEDSTLATVMRQVEVAQATMPPAQRIADKAATYLVPILIGLSVLTFLGWWLVAQKDWLTAFEYALTVIVISCPCALGLAAPLAVKMAVGRAARAGILVKDAGAFEQAATINTLIFDKTGTLTDGKPKVISTDNFIDLPPETLSLILTAVGSSPHPLAKAIALYLRETNPALINNINQANHHFAFEMPGKGFQINIGNKSLAVGSSTWLKECGVPIDENSQPNQVGVIRVWVAIDKQLACVFYLQDTLKPDAPEVIQQLQQKGIYTVLISGDTEINTADVAQRTSIKEFYARQLPIEKANWVKKLKAQGKKVGVIGDGINDTVAFANADMSIAMGSGTALALQTAQFALMRGNLDLLITLFELSKKTRQIIRQNLIWAFGYNIIATPLAMGLVPGIHLAPEMAAVGMGLSSILVVLNSTRLK